VPFLSPQYKLIVTKLSRKLAWQRSLPETGQRAGIVQPNSLKNKHNGLSNLKKFAL
jgi:hypothetical protein